MKDPIVECHLIADVSSRFAREQRSDSRKGSEKTNSVVLVDKNFDATSFLTKIHKGTSFKDLESGMQKLKISCEKQNEVMKNLVKRHFSKFVTAKANIDAFYQQMRQQNLISTKEYGIEPYARTLDGQFYIS